ncbi:MAG: threonine/serine exporter family protein [Clostridiales bacterium]|nr:threonine/serine exporter family protein [Clostridiales bacterium]
MTKNEIFSISLDIGKNIIICGGEVSRAKDTIKRINNAYKNDCSVFILPTLIIAQCGEKVEIRRIDREEINLFELTRLNELSRQLCSEKSDAQINKYENEEVYSKLIEMLAVFCATGSFSIFFGGTFLDALSSGVIGIIITYLNYKKDQFPLFSSNLIDSFVAGLLSFIPQIFGLATHYDKIIIGTIMLLVPGLTVVNAIRDMMNGDLVAGLIELINAIMSALAIAFGIAGALFLFSLL